jgi:hypothetical protein
MAKTALPLTERNGCRERDRETRAETVELRILKLRKDLCLFGSSRPLHRHGAPGSAEFARPASSKTATLAEGPPPAGCLAFCEAHCVHHAHFPLKMSEIRRLLHALGETALACFWHSSGGYGQSAHQQD